MNTIGRNIQIGQNQTQILDAGCGLGYASFWIAKKYPNWKIKGIDTDEIVIGQNIKISQFLGLQNLFFENISIEDISEQAIYDIVYTADVLEHIENDIIALSVLNKAIKKNGLLILHLPLNRHLCRRIFPWFKPIVMPDHVREEYTVEEITKKLLETGFSIIEIGFGYSWKGELAYELNYMFWERKWLRKMIATLLHIPVNVLAYLDVQAPHPQGNSIIVVAKPL